MTTTLSSKTKDFLKIQYGSYFNCKTPDVFYSKYIQEYQNAYYTTINNSSSKEEQKQIARDNYFNSISQTNNELKKVQEILNGSTITITSKVSVD